VRSTLCLADDLIEQGEERVVVPPFPSGIAGNDDEVPGELTGRFVVHPLTQKFGGPCLATDRTSPRARPIHAGTGSAATVFLLERRSRTGARADTGRQPFCSTPVRGCEPSGNPRRALFLGMRQVQPIKAERANEERRGMGMDLFSLQAAGWIVALRPSNKVCRPNCRARMGFRRCFRCYRLVHDVTSPSVVSAPPVGWRSLHWRPSNFAPSNARRSPSRSSNFPPTKSRGSTATLGDWAIVPDDYAIRTDQFVDDNQRHPQPDPKNLDVKDSRRLGERTQPALFLYEPMTITGTSPIPGLHNDTLEVIVDGDASGGASDSGGQFAIQRRKRRRGRGESRRTHQRLRGSLGRPGRPRAELPRVHARCRQDWTDGLERCDVDQGVPLGECEVPLRLQARRIRQARTRILVSRRSNYAGPEGPQAAIESVLRENKIIGLSFIVNRLRRCEGARQQWLLDARAQPYVVRPRV